MPKTETEPKRIIINDWKDLEPYGLNYLTGEACGYGLRGLLDLNPDGEALMRDYFSLAHDCKFLKNWNSKVNGKEATASIMLPARVIFPALVEFIMFHVEKVDMIIISGHSFTGVMEDDTEYMKWVERIEQDSTGKSGVEIHRNWTKHSSQPTVNGRSVHAMSGRSL